MLRYEDTEHGGAAEAEYDLVVLAVGVLPDTDPAIAEADADASPGATAVPGVFTAGAASAPRDIPESVLSAGAAAVQAAAYLEQLKVRAGT